MIVEYIGDSYKVSLIKGKQYPVIDELQGMFYAIMDETEEVYGFPISEFRIVEE